HKNARRVGIDFQGWLQRIERTTQRLQIVLSAADANAACNDFVMATHFENRQPAFRQFVVQKWKTHGTPGPTQTTQGETFDRGEICSLNRRKGVDVLDDVLSRRSDLRSGTQDSKRNAFEFIPQKIAVLIAIRPAHVDKRLFWNQAGVRCV